MMEQAQKGKEEQNTIQRFRFNLTSNDLQCFISKHPKSKSKNKRQQKMNNNYSKPLIRVLQQQSTHKIQNSPYFDFCFDHKVLFTRYGSTEVYVDEEPNNGKEMNSLNQTQSQDMKSQQVISQCVRAITEDTSDNLSSSYQSWRNLKFNNQQNNDMYRSRNKQNTEEPVFGIRPYQAQLDGRTTLMLRNIPNKYTQQMILQQVQAAGLELKYDFFYLPIDFKNDCNVGYAFINLIDVRYVGKLYEKFHGKKWPRFNSEKICQVCYARIQGTPQLLNHFRFSSAIQRDNRYRPLIYVNLNLPSSRYEDMQSKNQRNFSSVTI